ncbi:MAG: EAL domain-containing protein [Pseudomonadota bacterium]
MSHAADTHARCVALRRVDFARYTGLVKNLMGHATAVVICDLTGRRAWSLSRDGKSAYREAVDTLNATEPHWTSTGATVRRFKFGNKRCGYLTGIRNDLDDSWGVMLVIMDEGNSEALAGFDSLSNAMRSMAALVADDVGLLDELDSMTDELTQRYEELNLIYNTRDSVKYFDEGQDAIRSLVRNIAEYTQSSFCALVMADQKRVHSFSNPANPLSQVDALREVICADVFSHIAFRKEALIHNGGPRHRDLLAGIACKLMGCPVFDRNNDVIATLMLANPETAADMSSSDRKLLEVMAHKASRIIQANYDSLTGMMTRNGFEYHLETGLYKVRYKNIAHTVLNINIDRLHVVNDTCGHHAGDALIKRIGAAIHESLSVNDVASRLGGGEFGVLIEDREDESPEDQADRIRGAIRDIEFSWDKRRFQVSASIGMAPMEADAQSVLGVLSAAEVACAAAKELGRDRVQVYQADNTMLVRRKNQIHWLGHLQNALREDKFELYCQPIKRTGDNGPIHHAEVLLRLRDDVRGILGADVFMGSAERYNLMPAIDRWVIRNALKTLVANLPQRLLKEKVWAINLSGQSLSDPNFLQFIIDETRRAKIDPSNLCFEVTETAAVANLKAAGKFIEELRKHGFQFSLDDFGSGLSSFAYLKALPVDYLKIDGAIAKEVVADSVSASMVGAISQVARDMGLETIAEYVESEAIEEKLDTLGVNYVQGYVVGRPQPLRDALAELTDDVICGDDVDTASVPVLKQDDPTGTSAFEPLES